MSQLGITTPWFTGADKPVREGAYQARLCNGWGVISLVYTRRGWTLPGRGLQSPERLNLRHWPAFQWRGLTGPTI